MPKTLAEIAIDGGLVTRGDAARAGRLAESKPFVVVLVRDLAVDEVSLVAALHRQTRVPVLDPRDVHAEHDALREVPKDVCERLRVLPLTVGTDAANARVLKVAMADPTDTAAIAELEQITSCEIEVVALPLSCVEEWVSKAYKGLTTAVMKAPRPSASLFFVNPKLTTTAVHRVVEPALPAITSDGEISETARILVDGRLSTPEPAPGESELALRLSALVRVLVAKGLVTEDELEAQLQELLGARSKPGR